jgi:hypothetical protein
MARFKLRNPNALKRLGRLVLEAAEANGKARGKLSAREREGFQSQIMKLVQGGDSKKIKLVFDSAREIHIVIPWVAGVSYKDNGLAEESMGSIVMRGCAT